MKLIRQCIALALWLLCYVPTSLLVLLVMLNVVNRSGRELRAQHIVS